MANLTASERRLILLRHGESVLNAANRAGQSILCGQFDTPLTDVGRQQAVAAGQRLALRTDLRITTAISSALERARETLNLLVAQLPSPVRVLPPSPDLNERSLGEFEGRSEQDVFRELPHYQQDPAFNRFRDDFEQKAPGGENLREVTGRAWGRIERLLGDSDGDILVVSHAMTIRTIVGQALGLPPHTWLDTRVSNSQPIVLRGNALAGSWAGRMIGSA